MVIDLNLNNISGINKISESYSRLGEEYIFSHLKFDEGETRKSSPDVITFDGISFILCLKGVSDITINFKRHEVVAGTLLVLPPGRVLESFEIKSNDVEMYSLFLSANFINSINFDLNALGAHHFGKNKTSIRLTDEQTAHMRRYFELLHLNATNNTDDSSDGENACTRNIARNIIAAILYQLIILSRQYETDDDDSRQVKNRKVNYVREFFKLLGEHHTRERSVSFYANQLFISPKYLSLIIKENTGRSATDWIDSYVIMAAKNLLRYSGENIQQVAYRLNFSNQSAFGKYFKHLTGMSPTTFKEK